jgi:hypothetical protein
LTYLQAQKTIDETNQADTDGNGEVRSFSLSLKGHLILLIVKMFLFKARQIPVEEAVGVVHRIAQARRRLRLGFERSLYERKRDDCEEDIDNEREAHQMIEEIMVMANHLVAKYLLKKYPKRTPLRVQPPPKTRRVVEWRQRFQKFVNVSLGLEWLKDAENKHEETTGLKVPVKTWTMIMSKVRQDCSFQELVKLVCDVDLFPQLALANEHEQQLQQQGRYICSSETFENVPFPWPYHENKVPTDQQDIPPLAPLANELNDNRELNDILRGHWSLRLDAYCHFTSPIRRYIDIIVHRLVVASIERTSNIMDPDDLTTLCDRCTLFSQNSRRFDKDTKKLQKAIDLKGCFRFVSAYIDKVALDELKLFFSAGEFESLSGESVRIARLGTHKDPEQEGDHIKLRWTFRFVRVDKQSRAQPKLYNSQDPSRKHERQTEGKC